MYTLCDINLNYWVWVLPRRIQGGTVKIFTVSKLRKTSFVNFWSVYQLFSDWFILFQIVHLHKIFKEKCQNEKKKKVEMPGSHSLETLENLLHFLNEWMNKINQSMNQVFLEQLSRRF